MYEFSFGIPTRIIFGLGVSKKIREIAALFGKNVMIVTDPGVKNAGILENIKKYLGNSFNIIEFTKVDPNPKIETVLEAAHLCKNNKSDVVIGLGGGSSIDVAKMVATLAVENVDIISLYEMGFEIVKNIPLPIIAIPTTAGTGAELSGFAVVTNKKTHTKMSIGSLKICPKYAIADPILTITKPKSITASTGIDAFSHALEGFINPVYNPIGDMFQLKAIELIFKNLRGAVANGNNEEARFNMLFGSLLAGAPLSFTRTGVGHVLSHSLGGYLDVPHGLALSLLLIPVMEFNMIACMNKYAEVYDTIVCGNKNLTIREKALATIEEMQILVRDIGMPKKFSDAGFNISEEIVEQIAEHALNNGGQTLAVNPRSVNKNDLIEIINKCI